MSAISYLDSTIDATRVCVYVLGEKPPPGLVNFIINSIRIYFLRHFIKMLAEAH